MFSLFRKTTWILLILSIPLLAQIPKMLNYQGVLKDKGGNLLNGTNTLVFKLYDVESEGTSLWSETQNVEVGEGVFNVQLGKLVPFELAFDKPYWLGISVNGDAELEPRVQLSSVAYSINAKTVEDSSITTSKIVDGAITQDKLSPGLSLPPGGTAGGDLAGNFPNPSVNKIKGRNVSSTAPSTGQLLQWDGSAWSPGSVDGSLWQQNGSNIYFNSGKVGIGENTPKVSLHIGENQRVLFGADTVGAGDKLMWIPDLHAFRVGALSTGTASSYWDRDSIGQYSFAAGLNTRAQGFGGTALGRDTEAFGSYSFASGYFTNADGQYSTAMGFNTDALALGSTALGYSTDAEENYSTAIGYFTEAQAIYSIALGNGTHAQSYSSMAVGRYNVGGGNSTSWVSTDPIFEIGIGTSNSNRINAVTVRKDGNVGIGTTVPLAALHVNGQIRFATVEYFEDGGTNEIAARGDIRPTSDNTYDLGTPTFHWDDVYATNGTIQTSDIRDKENIRDLNYGLNEVLSMRPVRFTWKKNPEQGDKIGLIAQEVLPLIKEVVKTYDFKPSETEKIINGKLEPASMQREELDHLGIYYTNLIPVLIKAIQEQQNEIEELKLLINK